MAKKLTEKQYKKLVEQQRVASLKNDYSKMIMVGDENYVAMKKYFQDNICTHSNVETAGGIDCCKYCGKQW